MHAVFTFEITVGIVAVDFHGDGLDTSFVTFEQVAYPYLITMRFCIAEIHTHEHLCPVLRLCTACA